MKEALKALNRDLAFVGLIAIAVFLFVLSILFILPNEPQPTERTEEQVLLDSLYLYVEDISVSVRNVTRELNKLCLVIAESKGANPDDC
jgi:hypothetical protein